MRRVTWLLWLLLAWPTPALLAAALGWQGVWGSGSALSDYLIPVPVAGGALHVPSFALASLLLGLLPGRSAESAARVRALLLGMVFAGLLTLLNLPELWLALRSGARPLGLWQANPLGLFLCCDGVWALLFSLSAPQRPRWRLDAASLLALLLPCVLPLRMAWPAQGGSESAFMSAASRAGPSRGDEETMVYARERSDTAGFHAAAEAWAETVHPRTRPATEDLALRFTHDLEAARRFDLAKVVKTLCLFEDGSPSFWMPGAGDCFGEHASLSERFAQALATQRAAGRPDLQHYLAAREVCAGLSVPAPDAQHRAELASAELCSGLAARRETLRQRYPQDPLLQD